MRRIRRERRERIGSENTHLMIAAGAGRTVEIDCAVGRPGFQGPEFAKQDLRRHRRRAFKSGYLFLKRHWSRPEITQRHLRRQVATDLQKLQV